MFVFVLNHIFIAGSHSVVRCSPGKALASQPETESWDPPGRRKDLTPSQHTVACVHPHAVTTHANR